MAKKKDKDKVGSGAGGKAATSINKTIRGAARSFVGAAESLLGPSKRKRKKKN